MSNGQDPWSLIGWGVIIYAVICALPFLLVFGLIFYLEGGFGILAKLLLAGCALFVWIVLSAIAEQQKHK